MRKINPAYSAKSVFSALKGHARENRRKRHPYTSTF